MCIQTSIYRILLSQSTLVRAIVIGFYCILYILHLFYNFMGVYYLYKELYMDLCMDLYTEVFYIIYFYLPTFMIEVLLMIRISTFKDKHINILRIID